MLHRRLSQPHTHLQDQVQPCEGRASRRRGTATQCEYDQRHRRFREQVLARQPICVICRTALSTEADHYPKSRKQLENEGMNPNNPRFGRGLCKPCHSSETARHQPGGWHATQ